jgi:hypothetical protein
MGDRTRVQVARSEISTPPAIYESATQILAAFIASKQFNARQEKEFLRKSVDMAFELAKLTDRTILSTTDDGDGNAPF